MLKRLIKIVHRPGFSTNAKTWTMDVQRPASIVHRPVHRPGFSTCQTATLRNLPNLSCFPVSCTLCVYLTAGGFVPADKKKYPITWPPTYLLYVTVYSKSILNYLPNHPRFSIFTHSLPICFPTCNLC